MPFFPQWTVEENVLPPTLQECLGPTKSVIKLFISHCHSGSQGHGKHQGGTTVLVQDRGAYPPWHPLFGLSHCDSSARGTFSHSEGRTSHSPQQVLSIMSVRDATLLCGWGAPGRREFSEGGVIHCMERVPVVLYWSQGRNCTSSSSFTMSSTTAVYISANRKVNENNPWYVY